MNVGDISIDIFAVGMVDTINMGALQCLNGSFISVSWSASTMFSA